MNKHIAVSK